MEESPKKIDQTTPKQGEVKFSKQRIMQLLNKKMDIPSKLRRLTLLIIVLVLALIALAVFLLVKPSNQHYTPLPTNFVPEAPSKVTPPSTEAKLPQEVTTENIRFAYSNEGGIYIYNNGKIEKISNSEPDYNNIFYYDDNSTLFWQQDQEYFSYNITTKKTSPFSNPTDLQPNVNIVNGTAIYSIFSADENGGVWLYEIDREKKEKILDSTYENINKSNQDCYVYNTPKISLDGKKVAVTKHQCLTESVGDIEIFDLASKKLIAKFDTNNKSILGWAADSKSLFIKGCWCYQSEAYLGKVFFDTNIIEQISTDSIDWGILINDQVIYLEGDLYQPYSFAHLKKYDDKSKTTTLLFDEKLPTSAFSVSGNVDKILLMSTEPNNIYLLDTNTKELKLLVEDAGKPVWIE